MSIKAKAPVEDPETKARREAAERRAEAGRIETQQEELSQETLSVIRRFGRLSAFAGQRSLASPITTGHFNQSAGVRGSWLNAAAARQQLK